MMSGYMFLRVGTSFQRSRTTIRNSSNIRLNSVQDYSVYVPRREVPQAVSYFLTSVNLLRDGSFFWLREGNSRASWFLSNSGLE